VRAILEKSLVQGRIDPKAIAATISVDERSVDIPSKQVIQWRTEFFDAVTSSLAEIRASTNTAIGLGRSPFMLMDGAGYYVRATGSVDQEFSLALQDVVPSDKVVG
jgi:hypothetical protein